MAAAAQVSHYQASYQTLPSVNQFPVELSQWAITDFERSQIAQITNRLQDCITPRYEYGLYVDFNLQIQ